MKSSLVRSTLAALAVLAAAGSAAAQEPADSAGPRARIHLLPSIGSMGGQFLGREPGPGGGAAAMEDSRLYGLAAEVRSPIRGVDLRAGVTYASARVFAQREPGPVANPAARASISSVTLDAVVRGPRLLDFQPYLLVGAGARHFDFSGAGFEGEEGPPILEDQLSPVLRVGAGVTWDVGRYDLYLETSRQFSYLRDYAVITEGQAENSLSFGLRIPIR